MPPPPPVFSISFSVRVKDKEPKLPDFLSMGITESWIFLEYLHPGGHRMPGNLIGTYR